MPTASHNLALGSSLPEFSLPDVVHDRMFGSADLIGSPAILVMFICKHCPYVVHVREELVRLVSDYSVKQVAAVAISSNDAENYPDDSPANLREMALISALPFPVLYDESQDVARAFGAVCTPEFFVFDGDGKLAYHGRLDDSTPSNEKVISGSDLRAALDAVLAGEKPSGEQMPSLGCSIKWK